MTASLNAQRMRAKMYAIGVRLIDDLPQLPVSVIATDLRLHQQSLYRAWHAKHPEGHPRRIPEEYGTTSPDFRLLCETMLGVFQHAATRRVVQEERTSAAQVTATEVFESTEREYGDVCPRSGGKAARERRLYRALTALIRSNLVEVADGPRPRLYKLVGAK